MTFDVSSHNIGSTDDSRLLFRALKGRSCSRANSSTTRARVIHMLLRVYLFGSVLKHINISQHHLNHGNTTKKEPTET